MLFTIGRVCVKIAGRESGKTCVVVDIKDKLVLIDGNVRRKLCNPKHLEPLDKILKIKKGASTSEVKSAMEKENLEVSEKKKSKEKKKTEKPKKSKKQKVKTEKTKEPKKEKKPKKEAKK